LYLMLSWLPVYLVKAQGFSIAEMARMGAGIYGIYAITSLITGWGADRWRMAGATENRVRKTALITGLIVIAGCLVICSLAGPVGSVLALVGCGIGFGVATPAIFATAQTLAGPAAFSAGFVIAAVVALVGIVAYGVIVRRIEPIDWPVHGKLGELAAAK
jgi:MFS family permease